MCTLFFPGNFLKEQGESMAGVAELVNPKINLDVVSRSQYNRVERFIRHGVDKVMEGHKKHNSLLHSSKRYGRVSYFTASRVERPKKDPDGSTKPSGTKEQCSFRHVDYFITSGIAKGEGHLGGGTVTDMPNIGFNPLKKFNEIRVKRQHKQKVEGSGQQERLVWSRKLQPLLRRT